MIIGSLRNWQNDVVVLILILILFIHQYEHEPYEPSVHIKVPRVRPRRRDECCIIRI